MPQNAQPARLQLLNGNPNKKTKKELNDRIKQEDKLKTSSEHMDIPIKATKIVQQEYDRIIELYRDSELYSEADITTIARYADLWGEYQEANKELKKTGRYINNKISPALNMKLKLSSELNKLGTELGLTPSARAKLAIAKKDDKDDDDDDF